MNTVDRRLHALKMVQTMIRVTGMSLLEACRAVAWATGEDSDWLYRTLTE